MNNTSLVTEAVVLTQVNKWVGVIIAVIATLVVAPDGSRMLFSRTSTWMRAQVNRFRKRPPQSIGVVAGGMGATFGNLTMTATARAWHPNAPVDERIEALRSHISDIEGRLNKTKEEVSRERSAREEVIATLTTEFRSKLDELHQLLKEKDHQAATINARAIPVIGAGIFLNGVPEALAEIPWHLGWILPFAGFGLMIIAVMDARRQSQIA
ncbi:hypothetical protein [Nonomuraea sp. 10N515B]|uniref:hypothetical protein n=1 Tax=Nonomuraea sp. 10N515B TaxID=3457422 RepID=UPI003FCCEED3